MYVVPWARFVVDDAAVEATAIDACGVPRARCECKAVYHPDMRQECYELCSTISWLELYEERSWEEVDMIMLASGSFLGSTVVCVQKGHAWGASEMVPYPSGCQIDMRSESIFVKSAIVLPYSQRDLCCSTLRRAIRRDYRPWLVADEAGRWPPATIPCRLTKYAYSTI
jgi:hypothetical protein